MRKAFFSILALAATAVCGCSGAAAHPAAGTSAPARHSAIDGKWRSARLTEPEFVGWYEAAGGTAEDPSGTKYPSVAAAAHAFFATTGATRYAVLTVSFQSGQYALFESGDGQSAVLGDTATYTVAGNQVTVVDTAGVPCTSTYDFRVTGSQLRLHILKQCSNFGFQGATLLASFPYTRVS